MPAADWLRPPRSVLTLSLTVTAAACLVLVWLGWRMLQQEDALEVRRARERLENASDRAVSAFQRELAELDRVHSQLPEDVVLLSSGLDTIRVQPTGALLYVPAVSGTGEAAEAVFREGESAEFSPTAQNAVSIYTGLAASRDTAIQAGALLRLGRTLRKANRGKEALQVYSRLIALGSVRVSGFPAALIGREARCTTLQQLGDSASLAREASQLCGELASGKWPVTGPAWFYLWEEAQGWAGAGCAPVSKHSHALASAATNLWAERATLPAAGHRLLPPGKVLASWTSNAGILSATLAGERFLESLCRRVSQAAGARVSILYANEAPRPNAISLAAAATGLPWALQVQSADPGADRAQYVARRNMLISGFALTAALLIAGGYFTFRGIRRELALARMQSDFVSAVSHEFRTPLTSLRQLTDMLTRGRIPSEERRQQYYEAMASDTERLQHLVEGLLHLGRIESGAMRYRLDSFDAVEWVRGVAGGFQRQLEDGHIEVSLPDRPIPICADKEALTLALWNLLDNAFKYSPDCRTVWLSVAIEDSRVAIAVRDQGIGIPQQEQKRIFGKFVRGEAASSTKGTGIGLALVAHAAKAHHGNVRLESEPGRGSTFTLLLPHANGAKES